MHPKGVDKAQMLQELHAIAASKCGQCLADVYVNSSTKLPFICAQGHRFASCREYLKAGNWCPYCIGRGRTLADLQALAAEHGGRCLSPIFLGMKQKHRWECAEGHTWDAIPQNIMTLGRWCPVCGRRKSDNKRRRYTLADMQRLARARGGQCLASQFESVVKKVTWQCGAGHVWEATPHSIQRGTWCELCARKIRGEQRKTHTLEAMQVFAASKGGQCLSPTFVQVKALLRWECAEGHQWDANADNVVNGGKWCPTCAGTTPKTLAEMQQLATARGGQCLATTYQNINSKLSWECAEGHQWDAIPAAIQRGGWCPECSSGLGERICRAFFEQLLGVPFKKARPPWLRTPEDKKMELDGYAPSLRIAFEHQGLQHYKYIKHFHTAGMPLSTIQRRDQHKRDLCRAHEVLLIEVPSVLDLLGVEGVKPFIRDALHTLGIPLPEGFEQTHVDLRAVYCPNRLGELHAVAAQRGGKLLSSSYLGIFIPLEWECAKGHHFKAAPNNVKNSGSWCPRCAGKGKTIHDMRSLAASRGGQCLSEQYVDSKTPLHWQCEKGHQWYARPANVFHGTWCPMCSRSRGAKKASASSPSRGIGNRLPAQLLLLS